MVISGESAATASENPFAYRDFRAFFCARVLSGAALQVHNVAVGWLVWELTRSAWLLGLVGLAAFAPVLILALPAGYVADGFDRRTVIVAAWSAVGAGMLALAAYVGAGGRDAWPIFLAVIAISTARAFSNPASQALLPSLVPKHVFTRAIAVNTTAWQASSVVGPGIGGLLVAFSPLAAFLAAGTAFLAGAALVARLGPRPPAETRRAINVADLLGGISFIRSHPVILGAISLDLAAVLLGGAVALFPIFATDILDVGPQGLGLLRAAPPAGGLVAAAVMLRWPPRRRIGRTMLVAIGLFGVMTIVFGLSRELWLSLVALAALGAADMVNVVIRQSLVQGLTPDGMRGRVAAVNTVFIGASNEIGEFESGVAAALVGPVVATVLGGAGTVAVALAWTRLFPDLARRDRLFDEPAPE